MTKKFAEEWRMDAASSVSVNAMLKKDIMMQNMNVTFWIIAVNVLKPFQRYF